MLPRGDKIVLLKVHTFSLVVADNATTVRSCHPSIANAHSSSWQSTACVRRSSSEGGEGGAVPAATITMGGEEASHSSCDAKSCNKTLVLVSVFAALGGFLFGYDLALIGGALLYIEQDLNLDSSQAEIVVAGTKIGAIFGTFIGGLLMFKLGRKLALTIITAFFILGPIVMAVADSGGVLTFGRFISGLGIGAAAVVSPAYTAEMAPPSLRGAMVSM